jgi:hypothetical protein
MRHTKGPWKVEIHNGHFEVWANAQFIATTHSDLFKSAKKAGLQEANAKLIASAPSLLKALQMIRADIQDPLMDFDRVRIVNRYVEHITEVLRKAGLEGKEK